MCEFCKTLYDIRWCVYQIPNPELKYVQTVALLDESYKGNRLSGRITHTNNKFKLNFCPMCGRNVKLISADDFIEKGNLK